VSDPYAHPTVPEPESGQPAQTWPKPPGYQPPPEQRTNGFAIASLVFGIIRGILLAVIFGIIALVQIPKKNQKGKGLPAVPCDQPHEAEVFGMFDLPEGDYPTEDELVAHADAGCANRMAMYAPEAMNDPTIGFLYMYPLQQVWPADREVVCLAISSEGTMTGSLMG
jgi:Septum formation